MEKTILTNVSMTIDRHSDQSHFIFRFFVPEGIETIEIEFLYDPAEEPDWSKVDKIIEKHVRYYDETLLDHPKVVGKILPLKNLFTISVDDPTGFRGSCHRWVPHSFILLSKEQSTPGMFNRAIKSGMWNVIVNCHAMVTAQCELQLKVVGKHRQEVSSRWYDKPFSTLSFPLKKRSTNFHREVHHYSWVKSEIHTHTNHSDGLQTIEELLTAAKQQDIEWLAVTDHNTMSAVENQQELENEYEIHLLKGIEWTTFYGHLLTIGYDELTALNWSQVGPLTLEESIQLIKREGAITGIAHPFRPGSPFCTGCHWEYELFDLEQIDFIEVWNGENPHRDKYNEQAFELWTSLLNEGHQIAATCGRDWHRQQTNKKAASLYVYVPENADADDMKLAIKNGHTYITLGPQLIVKMNDCHVPGDVIRFTDKAALRLTVEVNRVPKACKLVIDSNLGILHEAEAADLVMVIDNPMKLTWIRACLYSDHQKRLAFTNAIYLEVGDE